MTRKVSAEEVTRFLDAWFAVRQVIQAWNFNRFQGTGLSATQFMTLNLLPSEETGIAMGELARRMNLKAATVAKTVDSLEARKLVIRRRSSADKRVISVQVTPEGMELQNSANGHFRRQIEELFSSMSADERAGLVVGLERMVQAAAHLTKTSGLSVGGHAAAQE
jgi:DNA-binding MarR family transcriptional regulator